MLKRNYFCLAIYGKPREIARHLTRRVVNVISKTDWRDRIHNAMSNLVGSRHFRRWAARFPLTQPVARRRARQLFDLCAGFVYSQVLLACVRLRVFDILAEGPQSLEQLSRRLSLMPHATVRLLDAAVSLRLLARRKQKYTLGPLGSAMIDNQAVVSMIEHHAVLYKDLADPVDLLRRGAAGGGLSHYWAYAMANDPARLDGADVSHFSTLMTSSQPLIADEVLDAYPIRKHRCLLDVGGGEGAFLAAAAQRAPDLKLMLFDLPAVVQRAHAHLEKFSGRVTIHGGSFLTDALPAGADVVSLVRVLHDHDDAAVRKILASVRDVIPDDGVLLIAEPMANTHGAESMAAYFEFYLFAMGSGRVRTPQRLGELLREAGFDAGRLTSTALPIQTRLLVARPVRKSVERVADEKTVISS